MPDNPARDSTMVAYRQIRQWIIRGDLPAGAGVSQLRLAKELGLSRGPVREALRLLERDGLVEATVNQRPRVAPFSIEDLEQLYAMRVAIESLAIRISVPLFGPGDLAGLEDALAEMDHWLERRDEERWQEPHGRFHRGLVAYAGDRMTRTIEQFFDHSERYRHAYMTGEPRAWSQGRADHREIFEACVERDAVTASRRLARHLSRTAMSVLIQKAPEHDPALVRAAVREVVGVDPEPAAQLAS
jgi:DNA-binding GntR family transcriptional regulator